MVFITIHHQNVEQNGVQLKQIILHLLVKNVSVADQDDVVWNYSVRMNKLCAKFRDNVEYEHYRECQEVLGTQVFTGYSIQGADELISEAKRRIDIQDENVSSNDKHSLDDIYLSQSKSFYAEDNITPTLFLSPRSSLSFISPKLGHQTLLLIVITVLLFHELLMFTRNN